MIDSNGRNISYMRVSLTDRCNLRCIYCMPENGVIRSTHDEIIRYEEIVSVVKAAAKLGIKKIRYTGGEPLILKDIDKLIYETSRIPGIEEIAITTNGILLGDMAEELKKAGLTRVNISLDTLKEDKFKSITRGGALNKVLRAIEKSIEVGLKPVKINTVIIKGINDDEIYDLMKLTRKMQVDVRFIELMPIGEGTKYFEKGSISSDEIIESVPELIPVESAPGSTARMYKLSNSKGNVGFISPLSCKFCKSCNRIRLTSKGAVKPCLHSSDEISVIGNINNEFALLSTLRDAIYNKPKEHSLNEDKVSNSHRMMFEIGG